MKKKLISWIFSLTVMVLALILANSCKKDDNAPDGKVKDIDGNVYHTDTIGTQVWMVENLKTTRYNDGTLIPTVSSNAEWANLTTPGYCWYNDDPATYKSSYGALYNWFAVNTGKLAPAGWHIPTDAEWTILTDFLGGETVAGGKMKEAGFTYWASPNTGADNSSGFSGLPCGFRQEDGTFGFIGIDGPIWSSTEVDMLEANFRNLDFFYAAISRNTNNKIFGFSVRCVKD